MQSFNDITLIGRLTKNPEAKSFESKGKSSIVTHFILAVNRRFKKNNKTETDFIKVTLFGVKADNANFFLKKGMLILVQGELHTQASKSKTGTNYYSEVIADRFEFMEAKTKTEEEEEVPNG